MTAGDALWGGFHPRIRSDLDDWSTSLDRLLEMDIDAMTFGHGPAELIPGAGLKDASLPVIETDLLEYKESEA